MTSKAYLTAAMRKTTKAVEATKAKTLQVVSDKEVQATAKVAAGGAVVVGTGGAATGFVAGGVIGAAVGVVPAIFTFGLSIPVMAMVGSGIGVSAGSAVGGTTGAVAGAGGYRAYTNRELIRSSVASMYGKACSSAKSLKEKVM